MKVGLKVCLKIITRLQITSRSNGPQKDIQEPSYWKCAIQNVLSSVGSV